MSDYHLAVYLDKRMLLLLSVKCAGGIWWVTKAPLYVCVCLCVLCRKLFVGQVPFEANEGDLWNVFSTIGNILELVILRTPQGKSKGCAFVTYETK